MYVDNNLPFLLEQSGKKGMKWGVRHMRPKSNKTRKPKRHETEEQMHTRKAKRALGVSGVSAAITAGAASKASKYSAKAMAAWDHISIDGSVTGTPQSAADAKWMAAANKMASKANNWGTVGGVSMLTAGASLAVSGYHYVEALGARNARRRAEALKNANGR